MQIKQLTLEPDEGDLYSTVDEIMSSPDACPANVAETSGRYISCGVKMKRRKSGVTICPIHGEMH